MSDTPRTDFFSEVCIGSPIDVHEFCRMANFARKLERELNEMRAVMEDLVRRCDGEEGMRADGSNIQTIAAHAILHRGNDE